MIIISHKIKISEFILNKKNLGFVPTMGGIHLGHISLIKRSIKECNNTVVSIFVNEQQFNRKSDFIKYPRVLNKDISILKKLKISLLFLPKSKEIYPRGYNKSIKINSLGKKLCGKFRPGHFEAVADIINRFLKVIKPSKIFLGEKDMQQLKILEDFIRKNHPTCKVVPCKTIREKNGVAYSSRNCLLNSKEKIIASKIFKFIKNNKKKIIKKKINLKEIKNTLYEMGIKKIDYIEIININKLVKPFKNFISYKIFIAYYLGRTRIIDNI